MGETRNRNSVQVNEQGKEKLQEAKAAKRNYDGNLWTDLDTATEAGVSEKTVERFFSGITIRSKSAIAIAKALDLELTDLIDAKATTPPPEILATLINWREVCSTMLEPHRRISSNFLMQDECARKDKEQIYVPLALVQRTKTDKRDKGNFSPDVGTRLYEPQYEIQQRFEHEAFLSQILEGGEGKTKGQQIAVIGEPGAGKTTLLQTIAFWVLEKNLGLPVWISLADLGRNGTLTDIQTYICNSWLEQAIPATQLTQEVREDFTNQIQQRRVWLLLDGVDEMSEASHQPLEEISRQLNGWLRSSRVVLTCRLNVWQADVNALETFETYRLLDFDYPQQVHQFIDNWFGNLSEKGERLKTELDSAERLRLRDLVQTPLRLALLCGIWQAEEGNLPETKAGLYHQCVQQFYTWKQNRFRTSKKEQHDLNEALGRLALRDINEGSSRFRLLESFISEELGYPDDETSLFYKAWQLGWLNHVGIAAESSSKEKVYAFYHPTFQEYFAACAIEDWDFFLPREHNNQPVKYRNNPDKYKPYRIFEPQWKEVILLWLGRENVAKQQKEDFIKVLVEFEDGCESFYRLQAYFQAAAGIAEFAISDFASKIIEQLIAWAFDSVTFDKNNFHLPTIFAKIAKKLLLQTHCQKLVDGLTKRLNSTESQGGSLEIALILLEKSPGHEIAVKILVEYLDKTPAISKHSRAINLKRIEVISKLNKFAASNPFAIVTLANLPVNKQTNEQTISRYDFSMLLPKGDSKDIEKFLDLVVKIDINNIEKNIGRLNELNTLIGFLGRNISLNTKIEELAIIDDLIDISSRIDDSKSGFISEYFRSINLFAWNRLAEIASINSDTVTSLVEILHKNNDKYICQEVIIILGKAACINIDATKAVVKILQTTEDEIIGKSAIYSLKTVFKSNLLTVVVTGLKDYIEETECYEIIWHCVQNMTYPAFYQAWHSDSFPIQN